MNMTTIIVAGAGAALGVLAPVTIAPAITTITMIDKGWLVCGKSGLSVEQCSPSDTRIITIQAGIGAVQALALLWLYRKIS